MRCVWIYLLPNQRAAQAEAGAREILPRARTPDLRPAKELIRNAAPRHCPPTRACQTAATRPTITRLSRAIFVTASRGSIIAASWAERGIARIRPTTPIPTVVCHVLDWCGATACARRLPAATRPARNAQLRPPSIKTVAWRAPDLLGRMARAWECRCRSATRPAHNARTRPPSIETVACHVPDLLGRMASAWECRCRSATRPARNARHRPPSIKVVVWRAPD